MRHHRAFPTVLVAAVALGASVARAEPAGADKTMAVVLYDQAEKLVAQGKSAEACPKFAESHKLDPQLGTLLHLADCYEKAGQIASAWTTWRDAAELAGRRTDPRESIAKAHVAALESKVPKLVVQVPPAVAGAGVEVERDGSALPRALWGVPVPTDPGSHSIAAKAAGRKAWSTNVKISDPGSTVTVSVPELEPEQAGAPAPAPTPPSTPGPVPATPAEAAPKSGGKGQKIAGLVVGGVGLVGVGIGTALGLAAKSKYDGADCHDGNICRPAGIADRDQAFSQARTATIVFGVGAAALAAGVVVWLTAPSSTGSEAVGIQPTVGPHFAGVSLLRAW